MSFDLFSYSFRQFLSNNEQLMRNQIQNCRGNFSIKGSSYIFCFGSNFLLLPIEMHTSEQLNKSRQ